MPKTRAFETQRGDLTGKRVLIVADDPGLGVSLQELLLGVPCRDVRIIGTAASLTEDLQGYDVVLRCSGPSHRPHYPPAETRGKGSPRYDLSDIAGVSPAIEEARRRTRQVAAVDAPVLITGETGTGKELFAQALHALSLRSGGHWVAVNLAAVPETLLESELFGYAPGSFTGAKREGHKGKFLQAQGGTIFLDEVGDLPLPLQSKLLRVLQEKEIDQVGSQGPQKIDVRVISATHQDLPELVRQGKFRSDLYYRLNVLSLYIPPLRERPEDVELLANRFLADLAQQYQRPVPRLAYGARDRLKSYWWPGNVRELHNAMEYAFTFSPGEDLILAEHLPAALREPPLAPMDPRLGERDQILRALAAVHGNKAEAARRLGISRSGLYVKLRELGIS